MKKRRNGFTLIEVSLFLAVSGAFFIMIMVGISSSVYQQRFNDSVQNFAEFLESTYSEVTNVQNDQYEGRSDQAIYGKLVVFGESNDLAGGTNEGGRKIFKYDVVGEDMKDEKGVDKNVNSDIVEALKGLEVRVVDETNDGFTPTADYSGMAESYELRWGARVEPVKNEKNEVFHGGLLVVRHPISGTVYTLVYEGTGLDGINPGMENGEPSDKLLNVLNEGGFSIKEVNFCVNPDEQQNGERRDVRVIKNARNSSGVQIDASESNNCRTGGE